MPSKRIRDRKNAAEPRIITSVNLVASTMAMVDDAADELDLTRSAMIRKIIDEYFEPPID